MKTLKIVLVSVMSFFLMSSCKAQTKTFDELNRKWMLISFKNYKKDHFVKAKAYLKFVDKKNVYANMGCNGLNFGVKKLQKGKISFGEGMSTMMYCEGFMDLEGDFAQTLPQMKRYKINGHHLTLSDGKGNEMKFVAADWD